MSHQGTQLEVKGKGAYGVAFKVALRLVMVRSKSTYQRQEKEGSRSRAERGERKPISPKGGLGPDSRI